MKPEHIRQWILARQPAEDEPLRPDHFGYRALPLAPLAEGQALARVRLINLHANTRRRMVSGSTAVGDTDRSNYACAEIVDSRDPAFPVGATIACQAGWQDYQVVASADQSVGYGPASPLVVALNSTRSQWAYVFREEIAGLWSPSVLMNMLGTSGMTAWFGLRECGPLMPRDAVAVANAGGAVGIIAAQLARRAGCRVVGFAGGAARCDAIVAATGIDACLDYRADDFDARLADAFPDGLDVFVDGIGGVMTERVVRRMNRFGRLLAYGSSTAAYSRRVDPSLERVSLGVREAFVSAAAERLIAGKAIKVESWIVQDFYHERLRAEEDLSRLMLTGALTPYSEVVEGFERLPEAVVGLYGRPRLGKLQLSFDPAPSQRRT